jgi:hypothetical protein
VGIATNKSRCSTKHNRNDHWNKTYKKYGMVVDVIADNISLESAKEMEKFLIASYGVKNLCNITLGGEGAFGLKMSEEHKEKLRQINKNRPSPLKGVKFSAERIQRMSEISKGMKMPESQKEASRQRMLGKKRDDEFCRKVSESKKGTIIPPHVREASNQKRRELSRKYIEVNTGVIGTIREFCKLYNVSWSYFQDVCEGRKLAITGKLGGCKFELHTKGFRDK